MRSDAVRLEETRLRGIADIKDYPWFKERHRVFPAIFEDRGHRRILDLSAGAGCAALRIKESYPAEILCNDICPACLSILAKAGLPTISFNLDDPATAFPFPDGSFDAAVSLVTIEHLIHPDHFLEETRRVLAPGGRLYISTPNYAAPEFMVKMLLSGRSFHDPLASAEERYEFFGHVRYFTYRTLRDYVRSFGFALEAVYIAKPGGSSRFLALRAKSKVKAAAYRALMTARHRVLPPRWAAEPILCFRKPGVAPGGKTRKVVL